MIFCFFQLNKHITSHHIVLSIMSSTESKILDLAEELDKHENLFFKSREKLISALQEYNKERHVSHLTDVLSSGQCIICNEDLSGCIQSEVFGIHMYQCKCNIRRIIHSKCWIKPFRCACGEIMKPPFPHVDTDHLQMASNSTEKILLSIPSIIYDLRSIQRYAGNAKIFTSTISQDNSHVDKSALLSIGTNMANTDLAVSHALELLNKINSQLSSQLHCIWKGSRGQTVVPDPEIINRIN